MIRKCHQACKPVVTATQMLESMINNPRPTRAEVSDVANAIYDSTSAIMLSGETAVGKYPIETVHRMRSIALEAENDFNYHEFFELNSQRDYHDISSAVSAAAVKTAYTANAKAIFAFTASGQTARLVSRLRPQMPVIAVTPDEKVYYQLASNWGIFPILSKECKNAKDAFTVASKYALEQGMISFGDVVVVISGSHFGRKGSTNTINVENIGSVIVRGHRGMGAKVSGEIAIVLAPEGHRAEDLEGRLVVISYCDHSFLPLLKKAKGLILQNHIGDSGSEKYAALVARTYNIPLIFRADSAMLVLADGQKVTIDPQKGLIYQGTEE